MAAPTPVTLQANQIDSFFLPTNFSTPYRLYVLQQASDLTATANQANGAAGSAYEANQTNITQQVQIDQSISDINDLGGRLDIAEAELADHELRITSNTNAITALDLRVDATETDITDLQDHVIRNDVIADQVVNNGGGSFLVGNIPSPTTDKLQVDSTVNTAISYKVAGNQVVSARETGWTADTGTAIKGGMNSDAAFTVSATYTQAEVQALSTALVETRRQLKAVTDLLIYHGLAGV
jgi:hypothetical protein